MGAGVSLSLSRDGVHGESICSSFFSLISDPFPRELGFYVGSVPFSREHVYYGSNLLEGVSLSANLLSPVSALIFVSLTRDHVGGSNSFKRKPVSYGGSYLPELRESIGIGT